MTRPAVPLPQKRADRLPHSRKTPFRDLYCRDLPALLPLVRVGYACYGGLTGLPAPPERRFTYVRPFKARPVIPRWGRTRQRDDIPNARTISLKITSADCSTKRSPEPVQHAAASAVHASSARKDLLPQACDFSHRLVDVRFSGLDRFLSYAAATSSIVQPGFPSTPSNPSTLYALSSMFLVSSLSTVPWLYP